MPKPMDGRPCKLGGVSLRGTFALQILLPILIACLKTVQLRLMAFAKVWLRWFEPAFIGG